MAKSLPKNLLQRVISAIALALPALASIQLGEPFFNIFIAILGVLMAWEWSRLCQGKLQSGGILLLLFVGLIPFLPISGLALQEAILIAPVICALLFALAQRENGRVLFSVGVLYLALPICAFIFLRNNLENGVEFVYWLVLVVVATDTGGYGFGLTIGGPKMAPRISPKKTWAGLLGGMLCACIMGIVMSHIFDWNQPFLVGAFSALLAIIAQIGDLFESHVKRTFNVKDSSNIIPGHGGVLDRMDGMLTAGAAFAAIVLMSNGHILSWF